MDNEMVLDSIREYLSTRWISYSEDGKETYRKVAKTTVNPKKHIISLDDIHKRIEGCLKEKGKTEFHFNSVINKYPDTDFIIAGLQMLNPYLYGEKDPTSGEYYFFQPVIRSVPNGKGLRDGMLRTFVNVGTVCVDVTLEEYFKEFELWVTILSKCSIYASSIEIQIKKHTHAFNGVGIRFLVGTEAVGQGNLYEIEFYNGKKKYVTDFGFGLERIVWATNSFGSFEKFVIPKYDYFFGKQEQCMMISEFVLMALSGAKNNSTKVGLKMKATIEKIASTGPRWNYFDAIYYYYDYWTSFISSNVMRNQIIEMFKAEFYSSLENNIIIKTD